MGSFLKHTSCTICGSSDARALYDGGSWYCFSCGRSGRDFSAFLPGNLTDGGSCGRGVERSILTLPDDISTDYSEEVLSWVFKYNVRVEELLKHNVKYSQWRNQLIFTWYSEDNELLGYQARNFHPSAKQKYFTQGSINDLIPTYYYRDAHLPTDCLVLVEDCLSAIKIARLSDAMPCLSSDLPRDKLKRLARLYKRFKVWLDSDMYHKAQRIAKRLQLLGCEADVIWTQDDPKCYSCDELKQAIDKH